MHKHTSLFSKKHTSLFSEKHTSLIAEKHTYLFSGNTVVSDRREAGACTDSLVDFYYADGRSVSDYYPFGMGMDSRTQSAVGYRWGFNGQEKDDEIAGEGNSYSAEFWQYDSRLGRRWNVDPVVKSHESSYATFANNPLIFIDKNGADTTFYREDGTYDAQAQQDFVNTFNQVKGRITQLNAEISAYEEQLSSGDLKKSETRRIRRSLESAKSSLEEWEGLKGDFDNIINNKSILFRYSSNTDGLEPDENGIIAPFQYIDDQGNVVGKGANIYIRPGHGPAVIHENKHGNQFIDGSFYTKTRLEIEMEAYTAQRVFDYKGVEAIIKRARDEQFQILREDERPANYDLEKAVRYIYRRYDLDSPIPRE